MFSFRDLPIRRKLMLFILLVSCLALVTAILAVISYERASARTRAVHDLAARAEMIGVSTRSALDFNDRELAREILDTLVSSREVLSACIYARDGTVFASYARPGLAPVTFPALQPDQHEFQGKELKLFQRILSNGEVVGSVYLDYDLSRMTTQTYYNVFVCAIVVLALVGLSFVLSSVLQRQISTPIMNLAKAAQSITARGDYSVRVAKESNDEIGQLTDSFNRMLAITGAREAALQESKEQLHRYADELELRVAERTATLQESLGSLQSVLYYVAHDLRAPLRSMQGLTTLLLDQCAPYLDATGKDYAARITTAAVRMDNLIKDLLEYGRLGHVELHCKSIDLHKHLRDVLKQLAGDIKARNAIVTVSGPPPHVCANGGLLDQVLTNLLVNAMKFVAPHVTPRIICHTEIREGTARLWIEDNGIGIAREHQECVFRVFERLHPVEAYPGTGIGLAIVRKGIERMGGRVGLESQLEVGSRFWIELPLESKEVVVEQLVRD